LQPHDLCISNIFLILFHDSYINLAFLFLLNSSCFVFLNRLTSFHRFRGSHSYYKREHSKRENLQRGTMFDRRKESKSLFFARYIMLQYPQGKLVYSFWRPSSFPFLLPLLQGNFSLGRSNRSSLFSSPATPNKCIPRELFFLRSGTHQSPCRSWPIRVRRRRGGFLEAFSHQVCYADRVFITNKMFY